METFQTRAASGRVSMEDTKYTSVDKEHSSAKRLASKDHP